MKIQIIGLGPGSFEELTLRTYQLLKNETNLILRTEQHPLVKVFNEHQINYESCDDFYQKSESFQEVYDEIVEHLISKVIEYGEVQYAVPGSPLVLEETVDKLLKRAKTYNIETEIIPALSSLDAIYASLKLSPSKGLIVLDCLELPENDYYIGQKILFTQVFSKYVASELKLHLLEYYPPEVKVIIIKSAGIPEKEALITTSLAKLDWYDYDYLTSVYLPEVKLNNKFIDLVRIVELLRSPEGCPWDKEQTHESLQTALLEETYEVLEALQLNNIDETCEELGDLLLQIVFHSVLAEEEGSFSYRDVIQGIVNKMIRRHPHVFANSSVDTKEEVLKSWEKIKLEEKADKNISMMDNIPATLPALLQADKIQRRAARVGFDWELIDEVWAKVYEELEELKAADESCFLDELGDVLFAVVNLARFMSIDAESALISTIRKFKKRFRYIEKRVLMDNKKFEDYTLDELDQFWNQAKKL